jgi:hypothetical protein
MLPTGADDETMTPKDFGCKGSQRVEDEARTVIEITADPSYLYALCDDGRLFGWSITLGSLYRRSLKASPAHRF